MKILIYIDSMAPAGGIERVVSKHIGFFSKNHNVHLLTKDTLESFYELSSSITKNSLNIKDIYNMNNKYQRIYQTIKQIFVVKNKLKKYINKFDLIYCTHIRSLLEVYISGVDMKKVIVTEHGSYYGYNSVYKVLKQFLYPKCKYIVSPTSMDYKIYKSQNCNAIYIPNPLSFYNDDVSSLDNNTIINIGRLTSDKRQVLLLEIWHKVSIKYPNWKLKIIGRGELKENLSQLINKYQINSSVEIIEPLKDIESVFLEASIFTFTSRYEGFGMVLAEAMSCGLPCISFDIPSGPRDIIENDVDGYLIENHNKNEYISKLEIMINNKNKRVEMGKNAKKNIKKFLDIKIEKQWSNLLKKEAND